jgi:hypothetical protein
MNSANVCERCGRELDGLPSPCPRCVSERAAADAILGAGGPRQADGLLSSPDGLERRSHAGGTIPAGTGGSGPLEVREL